MAKWEKRSLRLKKRHRWRAKPGYRIFVADRGAVRFSFPQDWVIVPESDAIHLYDKQPPDDNCRLAVSYIRLPPLDWSGLPLSQLVETALGSERRDILDKAKVTQLRRNDLEIAWTEIRFMDPNEKRPAFSRLCLGRGANIQTLITFDFWPEDKARLEPVWAEVMGSLELGRYISDPTVGDSRNFG
jgi:hypothetical protein